MAIEETIAAISTPIGVGGLSVIRISGPGSLSSLDRIFRGKQALSECRSHTVHFGHIVDGESGEIIDTVLATVMRAPHSYTGLDTVEISCHGGLINTRKILNVVLSTGVRQARPGEFTEIAYLNGKMDLAQVESVADLIHAKTEGARRATAAQFSGNLSTEVGLLRSELLGLCSLIELDLDFAEEHLLNIEPAKIVEAVETVEKRVQRLLDTFETGRILREGARVSIIGKPNVGKSSLLNSLLKTDRAIVSDIPGTTRDYLEEIIDIEGIPFVIVDTAGLRATADQIELAGIDRTLQHIEKSDVIIGIFDISSKPDDDDRRVVEEIRLAKEDNPSCHVILIGNKSDLNPDDSWFSNGMSILPTSILHDEGIDSLKKILSGFYSQDVSFESPMISRTRHRVSLQMCLSSLAMAMETLASGKSLEFASVDIRDAIGFLGEIIGEVSSQDVLNDIFSGFCIGK